jgi:hypothetical protein
MQLHLFALEDRVTRQEHEIVALRNQLLQGSRTQESMAAVLNRLSGPVPSFESAIISNFPPIFDEFRAKRFALLWRGSRDGFEAATFHSRCDGHANTLTVIADTEGSIFGGFTPLKWEADGEFKTDESLRSFLFTLKNPNNVAAKRFHINPEKRTRAIFCRADWGPNFWDIAVCHQSNVASLSYGRHFGSTYVNDTGLGGDSGDDRFFTGVNTFFTGSKTFQVREIEVFEISDSTPF